MWVKTRQEVELGIVLSNLTHTLLVMNPAAVNVVVEISGETSDIAKAPESIAQQIPSLTKLLKDSGVKLPVRLVFARNHNEPTVKVEEIASALI